MKDVSHEELLRIQNLVKTNMPNAETVAVKSFVEFAKDDNQKQIESRFIMNTFDDRLHMDKSNDVNHKAAEAFALTAIQEFRNQGVFGDFFIDIGLQSSGEYSVVEVKNLINGTIKNFERLFFQS